MIPGGRAIVIDGRGSESELSERPRIGPFSSETNGWAVVDFQRLIP